MKVSRDHKILTDSRSFGAQRTTTMPSLHCLRSRAGPDRITVIWGQKKTPQAANLRRLGRN